MHRDLNSAIFGAISYVMGLSIEVFQMLESGGVSEVSLPFSSRPTSGAIFWSEQKLHKVQSNAATRSNK